MEHDVRLARIEAALETLGGIVTSIGVAQKNTEHRLSETAEAMERDRLIMREDMRKLAAAQTRTEERMATLAEAQVRTEVHMDELAVKSAETQGKLDALIHMWDNWIVENGKSGKTGNPAPEPPAG